MSDTTKQCPFCAETIQAAAVVCRYCGRDLTPTPSPPKSGPRAMASRDGGYVCTACHGNVRSDATGCKHCGVVFEGVRPTAPPPRTSSPPIMSAAPEQSAPPVARSGMSPLLFGGIVVGILLACVVAFNLGGRPSGAGGGSFQPSTVGAWVDCKDFVTKNLKSPASAVFPVSNASGVVINHLPNGRWAVSGFVDADNSFGAKLRQTFGCQLSYTGDQVTVQKLHIGEQVIFDN